MAVPARLRAVHHGTEEAWWERHRSNRDWLLWAVQCAELFGRRWRVLPEPTQRSPQHVPPGNAVSCDLPAMPVATRLAREFARRAIDQWAMGALAEPVGLVVSELVTNALLHGPPSVSRAPAASPIQLSLATEEQHVMCAVTDAGSTVPVRRTPTGIDETGRGLQLVDHFSAGWGWLPRSTEGKVVWALFALPE